MEAIYDRIGRGYDTTRKADPRILQSLASLPQVSEDGNYLDVACGTGNYTVGLAQHGGRWQAFDHSETMLHEARSKSLCIAWHQMDVGHIRFPEGQFDGAVCTLAIHHFPDLAKAFIYV